MIDTFIAHTIQLFYFFFNSTKKMSLLSLILLLCIFGSVDITTCQSISLIQKAASNSLFSQYIKVFGHEKSGVASLTSRHLLGSDTNRFCNVQPDPNYPGSYTCQTRDYVTVCSFPQLLFPLCLSPSFFSFHVPCFQIRYLLTLCLFLCVCVV